VGSYENGNGSTGSIKRKKFLHPVSDYQILKNDSGLLRVSYLKGKRIHYNKFVDPI
jgi:hypothetical protein